MSDKLRHDELFRTCGYAFSNSNGESYILPRSKSHLRALLYDSEQWSITSAARTLENSGFKDSLCVIFQVYSGGQMRAAIYHIDHLRNYAERLRA